MARNVSPMTESGTPIVNAITVIIHVSTYLDGSTGWTIRPEDAYTLCHIVVNDIFSLVEVVRVGT